MFISDTKYSFWWLNILHSRLAAQCDHEESSFYLCKESQATHVIITRNMFNIDMAEQAYVPSKLELTYSLAHIPVS